MSSAVFQSNEGTQFPTTAEMTARAYELLSVRPVDALVSYGELATALGLDPSLDNRARGAVLRAGRRLLIEQRKKVVNVRTVGYRIIKPTEHVGVSQNEQKKARRWLREALKTVTHVALEGLTPTEVARVMTEQARAAIALTMARRVTRAKELPTRGDLHLPSTARLVDMMTRKADKR